MPDKKRQNILRANSTSNNHAGTDNRMLLIVPVTPSAICCWWLLMIIIFLQLQADPFLILPTLDVLQKAHK